MTAHILTTPRLALEPLTAGHAPSLWRYVRHPDLYRYIPRDAPTDLSTYTDRCQSLETRVSPDGAEVWLNWAMRLADIQIYIGKLEATIVADNLAYIAYELDPAYQGQGYVTEGCQAMIAALAQHFGVRTARAHADTRNTKSIQLLRRLGFDHSDTVRDADFFKGETSDEYVFELVISAAV